MSNNRITIKARLCAVSNTRSCPGAWLVRPGFILAFLSLYFFQFVIAAPITWQPAQNTTGVVNLLTNTPVFARNGGPSPVTVNGVYFNVIGLGSGSSGNIYDVPMISTGDANFDELVASFTYGGGASTTINIPGLVIGEPYQVQVFYNDQRSGKSERVMTYGDGLGNDVNVAAGAQAGAQADDYGQFATGSFTADAPNQILSLAANGFANCHLNALLVTTTSTNLPPAASNDSPNVVVLLTDDQVYDSLRCLGNSIISTPNLDRICTNGMIFNRAYNMGGWRAAVCQPSRTMFLTGRSLWHVPGHTGNIYPANLEFKSMPAVFNNTGYDTVRSGKSHNVYGAADALFATSLYHDLNKSTYDAQDETASKLFIDDALNWISNREAAAVTNPMLIYLGFDHPHDPRRAPQSFLDHFHASEPNPDPGTPLNLLPPLPPNYLPKHPFDNGHLGVRDEVGVEGVMTNRDERTIRNELGKVYATIEYLDSQVGRLLAKLDAMNQFTNTYFVFASDNGISNGRHGLMGKQNLYEHSLRVPLAISGPGISPGTNNSLVYLQDVFPTLCELTGLPVPDTVEGFSLVPILHGQTNALRASTLGAYLAVQRSVRVGDWKIIHYPLIHRTQLFNLADDPYETNDLSGFAVQADRIMQLKAQLVALQTEYEDYQCLGNLGYVGANVARGRTAWQSSTLSNSDTYAAINATDGAGSILTSFAQTADNDANAWWMVDLGHDTDIEEVLLHNRADANQGRLRDLTIELLDAQTNVVATSALLNPENTLGGGVNDFTNGPTVLYGGFTNIVPVARFVRVTRTPSSAGSGADKNALALSEVQVFAAPYDADGDGISDRWEREWFGDLTTATAATDWDHDGALDSHEAIAGTDPKDAQSFLKVDSICVQFPLTLKFLAVSNRTYTVQYQDDLSAAFWVGLTNIDAQPTNRIETVTDSNPAAAGRYYRLVTPKL